MHQRTLILLPCCYKKREGGSAEYSRSNCISNNLGPEGDKLMQLRGQVGAAFDEKHGPDLGFADDMPTIEYLEAYKRYRGNLYSKISESSWRKLAQTEKLKLVIVSALYGLVNWNEPIRYYNRTMDDNIRLGRRLNTWWRHRRLSDILVAYVARNGIRRVHSFLTPKYSMAVHSLSSGLNQNAVRLTSRRYQGLGSGSDYHRGTEVNALIQMLG